MKLKNKYLLVIIALTICTQVNAGKSCTAHPYLYLGIGNTIDRDGYEDQENPVGTIQAGFDFCKISVEYFHSSSLMDGINGSIKDVDIVNFKYRIY